MLAGFLMVVGIGFLGMLTGTIATFFVNKLSKATVAPSLDDNIKTLIKSRIDSLESLSEDELTELIALIQRKGRKRCVNVPELRPCL